MAEELTWRDWPAQRQRLRAAGAAAVILLSAGAVSLVDPLLAVVGVVAMAAAVAEVLLPTRYQLSDDGVTLHNPLRSRHHPWRHFASCRQVPDGVALAGAGPAALLRRRRELTLRCPGQEELVLATVRAHLEG